MVGWVETRHENVLTCTAMIHDYSLTIIGKESVWLWFLDRGGHTIASGVGNRLVSTKATVEAATEWLDVGPGRRC